MDGGFILAVEFCSLAALLLLSAFFSGSETALFFLNRIQIHRLAKQLPARGRMIEALMAAPNSLLSTILIGNTLVNVAAAALGYDIAERLLPGKGELVAIPTMTVMLLMFGEVTPKRLAVRHAEKAAVMFAPLLSALVWFLAPVRFVLESCSRLLRLNLRPESQTLSADEFLYVVEVGEEEGVLDEEERTMVAGIIRLEEMQASEVMTPRVDVMGIDLDDTDARHREVAEASQFHYLPVYRRSLDQPLGFLDVPRFLLSSSTSVRESMMPPFFVPETAPLDSLLSTFQKEERRIAFVTDEYGGTAGIVSRGGLLEEIVSNVNNEFSDGEPEIKKIGENKWTVEGSASIEDVNCELDLSLSAEGADRLAGWISASLERIPKTGDVVERQGCRVAVRRMRQQRVVTAVVEKTSPSPDRYTEDLP
jgi:putative hemolysin